MAFGIGDRSKLEIGVDPKVLTRNISIEDFQDALTLAEAEIVELERRLDAALAECERLRQRLLFVERALEHRRQRSNIITILGEPNGRKSQTE